MSWVKGRAKQIDADRGRSTKEDKTGNDGADALAVAGACLHQVPAEVLTSACERKELAVNVQRMMIKILQARAEAESNNLDDAVVSLLMLTEVRKWEIACPNYSMMSLALTMGLTSNAMLLNCSGVPVRPGFALRTAVKH